MVAVDRAIAAKICVKVECDVNYKTVLLNYFSLLSFILYELFMLIYAKRLIFIIKKLSCSTVIKHSTSEVHLYLATIMAAANNALVISCCLWLLDSTRSLIVCLFRKTKISVIHDILWPKDDR